MSEAPRSSRKMPAAPRVAPRPRSGEWLAPEEQADPYASAGYDGYDDNHGDDAITPAVPLLTLPTIPALPTAKGAAVAPIAPGTAKRPAARRAKRANAEETDYNDYDDIERSDTGRRRRPAGGMGGTSGRRPVVRAPRRGPRDWDDDWDATGDEVGEETGASGWDERDAGGSGYGRRADASHPAARSRQRSEARPLALVLSPLPDPDALPMRVPSIPQAHRDEPHLIPGLRPELVLPALAAHRRLKLPARPRVNTRAIVERARSPWSMARTLLSVLAISCALWLSLSAAGEPSQPLMSIFQTRAVSYDARAVTSLVQPETQGMRPDLYDSNAQFNDWWDAACSAAALSEIMTAWGIPHATIGKMIDVMQPDISLNGGLLTPHGFQRGAEAFGYRADINWHLTYKQLLYITNVLNLPVIVNVRISYGYYHFFSGGHFLVMTGGDAQGLKIVDSSEYYIHYLPLDTFNSMFTGMTAVIVPKDYQYSMPAA